MLTLKYQTLGKTFKDDKFEGRVGPESTWSAYSACAGCWLSEIKELVRW